MTKSKSVTAKKPSQWTKKSATPAPAPKRAKRFSNEHLEMFYLVEKGLKWETGLFLRNIEQYATLIPTSDEIAQMGRYASARWLIRKLQLLGLTSKQLEIVNLAQRALRHDMIFTMYVNDVPSNKVIEKIGKDKAVETVVSNSLYWGNIFP